MSAKSSQRFYNFIMGDDLDFYEQFIIGFPDDKQKQFFKEVPDFMSDFPVWCGRMDLLRDRVYRGILRRIKRYEDDFMGA